MIEYQVYNKYLKYARSKMGNRRFLHSISTEKTAMSLAYTHNVSVVDAQTAGILHDITKEYDIKTQLKICEKYDIELDEIEKKSVTLLHSITSAAIARYELGVTNENVLNAIRYHTTGRQNMQTLEKIIYIADFIEPLRDFDNREITKLAHTNLDMAVCQALSITIEKNLNLGKKLHKNSLEALEDLKSLNS